MTVRKHLQVDPRRLLHGADPKVPVYVRALDEQGFVGTFAVEELDAESLLVWLRSRDSRVFIEDLVGRALGYGYLHKRNELGYYPADVPTIATADPVEAIDARLAAMLRRPLMYAPSIQCFELLLWQLLDVRSQIASSDQDARKELLALAAEHGLSAGAVGPSSALAARVGCERGGFPNGRDLDEVIAFYSAWVRRVTTPREPKP